MIGPKSDDSKDKNEILSKTDKLKVDLSLYDNYGNEGSNIVIKKNTFKRLPILKSYSNILCNFKDESLINIEKFNSSMLLNKNPEQATLKDRVFFEKLKGFCHLHELLYFPNTITSILKNHHPSVVRINGYNISNHIKKSQKILHIVTERPVNGSLHSYFNFISEYNSKNSSQSKIKIKSNASKIIKFSNEQKYMIVLGTVSGIEFIHKHGFVHSKLDPTTIFLNEQLQPIICDYEFKHASKEIDAKIDIFKFGILVYYILTETSIFDTFNDPNKIAQYIINKKLPQFSKLYGKYWTSLITRCLKINPNERPEAKTLALELFDKDKMDTYIKSISPDYEYEFTDAQLAYINNLRYHREILYRNSTDDFDIFRFIDRHDIYVEDMETFIGCNHSKVECLKTVAQFFIRGEHNCPQDEDLALTILQQAKELNDPESIKMLAKLYQRNMKDDSTERYVIKLYEEALSLYQDDEFECYDITNEINKIKSHEIIPIDSEKTIRFIDIPNKATEANIAKLFDNFPNVKVIIDSSNLFKSAQVIFESIEDKEKALKKSKNLEIYHEKLVLESSQEQIQREIIKKRVNRTPLGSSLSIRYNDIVKKKKKKINLNDYHICGKPLGQGAFCVAYKINHKKKEKKYYVAKVFDRFKDDKDKLNFRREIKALSSIRCPLIIKYYGYKMHSIISPDIKKPTIIIEFAPKGTLANAIANKEKWFDDTTKVKAIFGILAGMSFIHNNNFIHRDLKPQNIFFDENYEIKIGDFNSSRKIYGSDVDITFEVGTPQYIAPELLCDEYSVYSNEIDVYPFGSILLEILTGELIDIPTSKIFIFYTEYLLNGWRPKIPEDFDENIKRIIELSWSTCINDRPSYRELFLLFKYIYCNDLYLHMNSLPKNVRIAEILEYIKKVEIYV